jgi:hypothetical protein
VIEADLPVVIAWNFESACVSHVMRKFSEIFDWFESRFLGEIEFEASLEESRGGSREDSTSALVESSLVETKTT